MKKTKTTFYRQILAVSLLLCLPPSLPSFPTLLEKAELEVTPILEEWEGKRGHRLHGPVRREAGIGI